ncbi:hypothetical protein OG589_13740 [Sphaerisporangium sp. NBC_01403]
MPALFWTHLNLYGRFELDMTNHLDLGLAGQSDATAVTFADPETDRA